MSGSAARQARRHPERHPGERDVALAWCRPAMVDGAFNDCVAGLILYDGSHERRIHCTLISASGPRIATSRNHLVEQFLKNEHLRYMLMLDTDMTFNADLLDNMYERAEAADMPVVGALCFAGGHGGLTMPTLFTARYGPEPCKHLELDLQFGIPAEPKLVAVDATGAACLLVRRDVFEKVHAAWAEYTIHPWFEETQIRPCETCGHQGLEYGEDVTFCLRARQCGFPIAVDLASRVGHRKVDTLTLTSYLKERAEIASRGEDAVLAERLDNVGMIGAS